MPAMDIADHQSSWVPPSASCTRFTSLPYATIVPLARAFARTFSSAAVFFSISAHCARGIAQFPTYEYMGGFSFTSDVCANAGAAQMAATAIAHTTTNPLPHSFFIHFPFRRCPRFDLAILGRGKCTPLCTEPYAGLFAGGGHFIKSNPGPPSLSLRFWRDRVGV